MTSSFLLSCATTTITYTEPGLPEKTAGQAKDTTARQLSYYEVIQQAKQDAKRKVIPTSPETWFPTDPPDLFLGCNTWGIGGLAAGFLAGCLGGVCCMGAAYAVDVPVPYEKVGAIPPEHQALYIAVYQSEKKKDRLLQASSGSLLGTALAVWVFWDEIQQIINNTGHY